MKNNYNKEFNIFLNKNKNFNQKQSNLRNNTLIVSVTNNLIFNTILLKFGKAISETESSNIIFIPFLKPNKEINKLIKSFRIAITTKPIIEFIKILIKYIFNFIIHLFKIKNGQKLESYLIDNIPVGKHIYDYILIRNKIPSIDKLSIRHKLDILICLFYYFLVRDKISKHNIKSVITLDNVYIEGIVFELSKYNKLKMYTGFDINLLTLHLYVSENDYDHHCRTPDKEYISEIFKSEQFKKASIRFLETRFSGNQNQHDAKRAFSSTKIQLTRTDLINKYHLNDNKIVLVLPHVFCDAPHAYPSVFYQDYEHWIIDTLQVLNKNININVIIKEHPSADLYSEKGYLEKLLNKLNMSNVKLISNDINSKSLMNIVDSMITCGGTSGMEYAYHGVPVIIASSPPYGGFNFVNKASNRNHYHELLNSVSQLSPISREQQIFAANLLFLFFKNYGIDKDEAKMNCFNINLGEGNDLNHFFSYISKDENIVKSHFVIKKALDDMLKNNFNNLYKD
jgi:hypothetical protein